MRKNRIQTTVALVLTFALGSSFLLAIPARASREINTAAAPTLDKSGSEMRDLLVKRVGHEPENAIAEVRRSFDGSYPPLY